MATQNERSGRSTASKWLIGCGIGCGVAIILAIILGVSGFFFVRNIVQGFKETETLMDTITERYGRVEEFCPDPEGIIKRDRLEAFLFVRRAMAPAGAELEDSMNILSYDRREEEFREGPAPSTLTKIKTGFRLVSQIAEFYRSRNQALLDTEMGLGEYYFIYVVSYFSWLGKSPADGPPFQLVSDEGEGRSIIYRRRRQETQEDRMDFMVKRLHRQILPMLQNQYEKLTESDISGAQESWQKQLKAEIEALESDRFRLPWQDGLPKALKFSLEPFRTRLEASYKTLLNPLEIVIEQ
ncbi:MAG: hypothetical protein JSV96_02680 [Candidatus Aminicenantes bacterium]|nr:MAG: hypothetical protein JSV96_02680 [Candidatus Aminicenantes bacterium]